MEWEHSGPPVSSKELKGEVPGVTGSKAGLDAASCCVTVGKSPTLSAPSTTPDTDIPYRA